MSENRRAEDLAEHLPWLDDPDAPPTAEELAMIAKLDGEMSASEDEFAEALKAAYAPQDIDHATHERLVSKALEQLPTAAAKQKVSKENRVAKWVFGASTTLAIAAGVALILKTSLTGPGPSQPELVKCRTTADLFAEPFAAGEQSSRLERISAARERDLRANSFARWGVR